MEHGFLAACDSKTQVCSKVSFITITTVQRKSEDTAGKVLYRVVSYSTEILR